MATKQIKDGARKIFEPARRKATTFRLEPRLQSNLSMLGEILKTPLNRLVNEAVADYLERRTVQVESDLQRILDRIKAARKADPHFESAIRAFSDSEANLGSEDPAEGRTQPS